MIEVIQESSNDENAVNLLVKEAFADVEHSNNDEHLLIQKLRKCENYIPELNLIAKINGEIAGHIMFTKVKIGETTQLALAPLCVLPKFQKQGIGKALIEKGHVVAKKLGYSYSVVLGSDIYYHKHRYKEASEFGIKCPFSVESKYFMAIKLQDNGLEVEGTVLYDKSFTETDF